MERGEATTVRLNDAVQVQPDSIVSRTVFKDDQLKVVLFGFGAGQELSEHTSSKLAVMHFLTGEAEVTLGKQRQVASPGTWIHMPAGLPHAIIARQPTTMLLYLMMGL
jgi:quercetin dioxygenase-like cupin family protein